MDWKDFRLSTRLNLQAGIVEDVYKMISEIDAVKTSWQITGSLLPQTIERLTHSVLVTSTGASNRIEGNLLTDEQVEQLYKNMRIKKLATRDDQEVVGYIQSLEIIFESFNNIPISESTIKQLHGDMLQYSEKDIRHKGGYKMGSNRVEAKDHNGHIVGVIFDPTPPHLTPKEMQELVQWYKWAKDANFKHPLILLANFIFEYLAIHPFQDGNGRTSRLLTNLILLREGYHFTTLVSHEKIVEANKADYYLALNRTQKSWKTDHEDLSPFLMFFLQVIQEQAREALKILTGENTDYLLSGKQLALWQWASTLANKEFTRMEAVAYLGFPIRTVESIIKKLLEMKRIERLGEGRATRYRIKGN